ncbi:hypothetical protein ANN_19308 [Periplaneta americana]|uniref:RNase H type-1 domain-containing protein n=1 Tax=Periplaneta americana TaxID=6978 RepID=A0ABQ8SAH3_PERAM|nr:hypothetical protein ANN_19308 [Periplaneta americana]
MILKTYITSPPPLFPALTGTVEAPCKSTVRRVAAQLHRSLSEKGLALLVNHGIPDEKNMEVYSFNAVGASYELARMIVARHPTYSEGQFIKNCILTAAKNVCLNELRNGSKTEEHVGAGVVAVQKSLEIYTGTQRLGNECSVFQAELIGIKMAIDWIISQRKDETSYGIHVDSQAGRHAVANKRTTQPIPVYIRKKMIDLKKTTEISLSWIKDHSGIKGNERANYLAIWPKLQPYIETP